MKRYALSLLLCSVCISGFVSGFCSREDKCLLPNFNKGGGGGMDIKDKGSQINPAFVV